MSWSVICRRCEARLLGGSELVFIRESERAVHLSIRPGVVHEVETRPGAEWLVSVTTAANGAGPTRAVATKLPQQHVQKRVRAPFVLQCLRCQSKLGSCVANAEWPAPPLFLLDAKECAVHDANGKVDVGKHRWRVILEFLQARGIPEVLVRWPKQLGADLELASCSYRSENGDPVTFTSDAGVRPMPARPPMVYPTPHSIRETFTWWQKLTRLRDYQVELAISALLENTIVYLPTGCGKTLVAVKVLEEMHRLNPQRLAAVFVPTGPLVTQQAVYVRRETDLTVGEFSGKIVALTDATARRAMIATAQVIVATPQYWLNRLRDGEMQLTDFSVLVFDEAHHATGNHPYNEILGLVSTLPADARPRILALTASPFGSDRTERSSELCGAFDAVLNTPTITNSLSDHDTLKHVEWILVRPPAAELRLTDALRQHICSFQGTLQDLSPGCALSLGGDAVGDDEARLYELRGRVRKLQQQAAVSVVDTPPDAFALLLGHIRRMLSTLLRVSLCGPVVIARDLADYFSRLEPPLADLVRASASNLITSLGTETRTPSRGSHKVQLVVDALTRSQDPNARAIVFVRRRKTALALAQILGRFPAVSRLKPTRFIGHNSYEGMSWEEEQKPTLEGFRTGHIRLLVATNVLEEGLDVPECSMVIQFDGVTGITSLIQSRGRARRQNGRFVVLCTENDRMQRVAERECVLAKRVKLEAAQVASKVIVESIMRRTVHIGSGKETNGAVKPIPGKMAQQGQRKPHDPETFCVGFGSSTTASVSDLREGVVSALEPFAKVHVVDASSGLIGLQSLHVTDNRLLWYDNVCRALDFRVSHHAFWLSPSDPSNGWGPRTPALDRTKIECGSPSVGLLRSGCRFEETFKLPLDASTAKLELLGHLLVIRTETNFRVELDLKALYEPFVWLQRNGDSWTVFATFSAPPKLWSSSLSRTITDFNLSPMTFAIHAKPLHASCALMWTLRMDLLKLGIQTRDIRFSDVHPLDSPCDDDFQRKSSFDVVYALLCLRSAFCFHLGPRLPKSFYDILRGLQSDDIRQQALLTFRPRPGIDVVDHFREFVELRWPVLQAMAKTKEPSVLKIVVFPSRIHYCRPELTPGNRVFRHFGPDKFMYVHFRDECMERLDFSDSVLSSRIRRVLTEGVRIEHADADGATVSTHFQFLGASHSQVRNASALFTSLDPRDVRGWIGNLQRVRSPAKYFKRLAQAFSSTRKTFAVDDAVLENVVPDFEHNSFIFNDGCGEITLAGADMIAKSLGLTHIPSAFQIRLAGAKGVLVVSDYHTNGYSPAQNTETCVRLRKSMVKFESPHRILELVAHSGWSPAFLTRQSIQILSCLGIPDDVFLTFQDDYISLLQAMVATAEKGLEEVRSCLPVAEARIVNVLYRVVEPLASSTIDPYHRRLVTAMYHYKLTNTILRARIPVSKGRNMMGVADFTGILEEGEVFVQYTERDSNGEPLRYVVLDCDVLVHRSPCHHPGDIRVLRCRSDVPDHFRRHVRDCIVFPTRGSRPHPTECTGGDLDGDMYTVIWDQRLIPRRDNVVPPMAFDETSMNVDGEVTTSTMIDFFLGALVGDILGVASNAHLAISDESEDGCFDPRALVLAEICAKEVDCRQDKSHSEIVRSFAPSKYPDFMQNAEKPSYTSQKVLGRMYRRCLRIKTSTEVPHAHYSTTDKLPFDSRYLVAGYEEELPRAREVYQRYKYEIQALLMTSGATSEAELATGMVIEPDSAYKADYFRFGELCKDRFYRIQTKFRDEVSQYRVGPGSAEMARVASAWYHVAYSDTNPDRQLSFPWILGSTLVCNVAAANNVDLTKVQVGGGAMTAPFVSVDVMAATTASLQLSIWREIASKREELIDSLFQRLSAVASLRAALEPHLGREFSCLLFGSSALLTFEPESDLDVSTSGMDTVDDLRRLATFIATEFGVEVEQRLRTNVPILRFSRDEWDMELCGTRTGPQKTWLFRAYMSTYAFYWPCVYMLLHWGKNTGLIRRRAGGGHAMLSPIGFLWLFTGFCCEAGFISAPLDPRTMACPDTVDMHEEVEFWSLILDRATEPDRRDEATAAAAAASTAPMPTAAAVLLAFLGHFAATQTPDGAFAFRDPIDPANDTQLSRESVEIVRELCYAARHQLVISGGDVATLMTHVKDQRRRITLSRALSRRVGARGEFIATQVLHDAHAHRETRLRFVPHPNVLRPGHFVAEIVGDGESVRRTELRLQGLEDELGTPRPRRPAGHFHHAGCSLLLFEGASSRDEPLGFQLYHGERQVEHEEVPLYQAHLVRFVDGGTWLADATVRFGTRFVRQMIKLAEFERLNPSVPRAKAIVRFGHHYLIHLPWAMHEEALTPPTIDELELALERGRVSRDQYESILEQRAAHRNAQDAAEAEPDAGDEGDDDEGKGPPARNRRKEHAPPPAEQKQAAAATRDRNVAHSFCSMVDPAFAPTVRRFAEDAWGMRATETSESYQVAIVHHNLEFNVRLSPGLELVGVRTRPRRWFSATVKMRQELVEDGSRMDATPDLRYYVSTSEDVPPEHALVRGLRRACAAAPRGHGILAWERDDDDDGQRPDEAGVTLSPWLWRTTELSPAQVPNVRHLRTTTFECPVTGRRLRLQRAREFVLPRAPPARGFFRTRARTEVEIVLPPLSPEARVSPAFAAGFLAAGTDLVAYLRDWSQLDLE